MRRFVLASLAIFLFAGVPAAAQDITVYRCQDKGDRVTLQDEPCTQGQQQTERRMTRPRDPAPAPAAAQAPDPGPPADDSAPAGPPPAAMPYPPPPLFQCTNYDGDVRYSEDYDPETACVPLAVLGYDMRGSANGAACRWVSESCLRLDDGPACEQFKAKLRQARSDALHAFSDTAAYRKSEATRLGRIVDESCR